MSTLPLGTLLDYSASFRTFELGTLLDLGAPSIIQKLCTLLYLCTGTPPWPKWPFRRHLSKNGPLASAQAPSLIHLLGSPEQRVPHPRLLEVPASLSLSLIHDDELLLLSGQSGPSDGQPPWGPLLLTPKVRVLEKSNIFFRSCTCSRTDTFPPSGKSSVVNHVSLAAVRLGGMPTFRLKAGLKKPGWNSSSCRKSQTSSLHRVHFPSVIPFPTGETKFSASLLTPILWFSVTVSSDVLPPASAPCPVTSFSSVSFATMPGALSDVEDVALPSASSIIRDASDWDVLQSELCSLKITGVPSESIIIQVPPKFFLALRLSIMRSQADIIPVQDSPCVSSQPQDRSVRDVIGLDRVPDGVPLVQVGLDVGGLERQLPLTLMALTEIRSWSLPPGVDTLDHLVQPKDRVLRSQILWCPELSQTACPHS